MAGREQCRQPRSGRKCANWSPGWPTCSSPEAHHGKAWDLDWHHPAWRVRGLRNRSRGAAEGRRRSWLNAG
eukprot:9380866-Alexandrium_andersonii.AAC.1